MNPFSLEYRESGKQRHKIEMHPGDWWGDKGCATCGRAVKIVSIWSQSQHFFAHDFDAAPPTSTSRAKGL